MPEYSIKTVVLIDGSLFVVTHIAAVRYPVLRVSCSGSVSVRVRGEAIH